MPDLASDSTVASGREQRRSQRFLTLATATIAAADGAIDCAVLNISEGGACLLVADATEVPDAFELLVDPGRIRIRCVTAWRSRHHVGVAFATTDPRSSPPPEAWPPMVPMAQA